MRPTPCAPKRRLGGGAGADVGPVVAVDELEAVGLVGVADEEVGAVGGELGVVVGAAPDADGGEVREVVGAAPADGEEVVDLEAGAAGAAGPAAVAVAQLDRPGGLGRQRGAGPATVLGRALVVGEDGFDSSGGA